MNERKTISVFIFDIVLFLQLRKLLFSASEVRFCRSGILLSRHMIEYDYVSFLKMESVEVI